MFDDIFNATFRQMDLFSETARDEFGRSLVVDVFEPLLREIDCLRQMNEWSRQRVAEMDRFRERLESVEDKSNEQ